MDWVGALVDSCVVGPAFLVNEARYVQKGQSSGGTKQDLLFRAGVGSHANAIVRDRAQNVIVPSCSSLST